MIAEATLTLRSPLGQLRLREADGAVVALDWVADGPPADPDRPSALLDRAATQLDAYFYCELAEFDLPLAPAGSDFQRRLWDLMRMIPRGRTRTYGEAAALLGSVARAVGTACGTNPIPILIPCHRIVAATGSGRGSAQGALGGYSGRGGAGTKRFLLELEGALPPPHPDLFPAGPDAEKAALDG